MRDSKEQSKTNPIQQKQLETHAEDTKKLGNGKEKCYPKLALRRSCQRAILGE
jgi:hypothetical protein